MVHQLKTVKQGYVVTKCGREGRSRDLDTTVWGSSVTCPDCISGRVPTNSG